ncbi:hypothetical protein PFISCL1PPCAC_13776, partial [Pristionchus fissidentatus]
RSGRLQIYSSIFQLLLVLARNLETLTAIVVVIASIALCILIFIRMRLIIPANSRFQLSHRQSMVIMGLTSFIFLVNIPGFALYAGD